MRAYIDTDILIWHLRGDARAANFLQRLRDDGQFDLWIGAMQRVEVVFYLRGKEEEKEGQRFLSLFKTEPVDQEIVDSGAILYRRWHPSHGVGVNDALLAATVMKTGGQIYCLNTKHYPMPDLLVKKAW